MARQMSYRAETEAQLAHCRTLHKQLVQSRVALRRECAAQARALHRAEGEIDRAGAPHGNGHR